LEAWGPGIDPADEPYPAVWHGPHAAQWAVRELGLSDAEGADEIAEAVSLHSTADRAMGRLARVLFVADALEPTRGYEGIDELRALARRDLDSAFSRVLERKCAHLSRRGEPLSPRAQRALEELQSQGEAPLEQN
jgi:HD superfamily phosphohydrolase YqeK